MKKLLVVDHDKIFRQLCARELMLVGYKVATAATGREALRNFTEERPDLVVLDINAQEMEDLEAIGGMANLDRSVPMVCSSAYPNSQNLLARAADVYVEKSPDLTGLKQYIENLLKSRSNWARLTECQLPPIG
jgi:CheY-like chemotaxis protein